MLKFFDHYRGTVTAVIIWIAMTTLLVGCQPKVVSPSTGEPVTRSELTREAEMLARQLDAEWASLLSRSEAAAEQYKLAFEEIEQREQAVRSVTDTLTQMAASFDPSGGAITALIATSLVGLGWAGTGYDARRKDKIISDLKPPKTPEA